MAALPVTDEYWVTHDGRVLKISEMNSVHIRNCVAKMLRSNWKLDYLEVMQAELRKRAGEEEPEEPKPVEQKNSFLSRLIGVASDILGGA